ncbi:MAG: DNA mismatch repair endonuclease MutL [Chitinivibrionales bacterium]|nr:DNA mismatch repair endonuclease MutL [Chitinivibrionales bacterium]
MEPSAPRIVLLPPAIIQKIAAGEVIERPASVVKELVENALDAGATRIDVSVEDGGFALIAVKDNGLGMSRDDLPRSVERHATSKLRTLNDLFSLNTMGFRGEALASVAAVSRLTIESSAGEDGLGFCLSAEGSLESMAETPPALAPCARTRGTTVACRDLFFNVPARKKFMKSPRAERMAVGRLLEQLIVPFPPVHCTADFDGARAINAPPVETVRQRIAQVNGADFAQNLVVCTAGFSDMQITIFILPPDKNLAARRCQNLYVNSRRVENDAIAAAIREGYGHFAPSHVRPSYYCLIEADPHRLDVNVHPTKQRIKFDDERVLFGRIAAAVRQGLGPARAVDFSRGGPAPERPGIQTQSVRETLLDMFEAPAKTDTPETFKAAEDSFPYNGAANIVPLQKKLAAEGQDNVQLFETAAARTWNLISCYQIHATYILAPIKNGIVLIDQHAAHERILFEQALAPSAGGASEAAQLLFPAVIELTSVEKAVVVSGLGYFARFGFTIEDFGGNAIVVSATPPFLSGADIEGAVREIVRNLLDEKESRIFTEAQVRFAAAFACGAAIKAGQKLSQEEMNGLFNSLFAMQNPYTCPHGRPTLVRISLDELARRFLR